jgi:hypothetical protein
MVGGFGGDYGPAAGAGNEFLEAFALTNDSAGTLFLAGVETAENSNPAMLSLSSAGTPAEAKGYAVYPDQPPMNGTGYLGVACGSTPGVAVVVADGSDEEGSQALIARITTTGALDTTFNGTGFKETQTMTTMLFYSAVAIDPFGRIVVVGSEGAGFYVTRIWP